MRRIGSALLIVAAALAALAAAPPAAQAEVTWLCRPGLAENPCEASMRTTVNEPGGGQRIEDPRVPPVGDRPVDCFYVYPTVSNQPTPNASKARDPEVVSIAEYQAARFSLGCRVFAPIYRQGTLAGIATAQAQDTATVRTTAFADVREAWRAYLERDNGGRGVVLIGHSQGTRMLRQLVRTEIDKQPKVRERLVGALLLGGNVTVRRGATTGGDFANVPLCTQPGQAGCVVAYSTFSEDPPPDPRYGEVDDTAGDPFGFPSGPEYEVACTDPRRLAGTDAPLRMLVPSRPYAPGPIAAGIVITSGGTPPSAPTPWVTAADRWSGGCRTIDGARVLKYDPAAPGSRRPVFFPDPTWGTHLVDVNLTLDPLVEVVRRQTRTYLAEQARAPELRLVRRCVGRGRLRVGLRGDVGAVRSVAFKLGRRTIARGGTTRTLSRTTVRRARGKRLRAVVELRGSGRTVLARNVPSCGIRR